MTMNKLCCLIVIFLLSLVKVSASNCNVQSLIISNDSLVVMIGFNSNQKDDLNLVYQSIEEIGESEILYFNKANNVFFIEVKNSFAQNADLFVEALNKRIAKNSFSAVLKQGNSLQILKDLCSFSEATNSKLKYYLNAN